MASAGGGVRAADEIRETVMDIVERPPEDRGRVGSKGVRDSLKSKGSHGFSGVTTSEKKAVNTCGGNSRIGHCYLHGTHGEQTLSDSNMLRNKTKHSSTGNGCGKMLGKLRNRLKSN